MRRIVIDPGHGGTQTGAASHGYVEKNLNLTTGLLLGKELTRCGFAVNYTRTTDTTVSLEKRGALAISLKADAIVSVHFNGFNGPSTGFSDIYSFLKTCRDKSQSLANNILKEAVKLGMGQNRVGAWTKEHPTLAGRNYYGVLRNAEPIPGVILEGLFLTNDNDVKFLAKPDFLQNLAIAYAKGICAEFGVQYIPATAPAEPKHPIMGKSVLTAEQMDSYVRKINPAAPALAHLYLSIGEKEGVRGDIAFVQSIKETAYFKFGGDVSPDQYNYAGIGATGGGAEGASFDTPEEGITAQIQHLKAYASAEALKLPCVDPRYSLVQHGIAKNWEDLNGKWAVPGTTYGQDIMKLYDYIAASKVPADYKYPIFIDMGDVSSYAKDAVTEFFDKGFIEGDKGKFNPQDFITREDAVVIIQRVFNSLNK